MKVQQTVYDGKSALALTPETLHEKAMLKKCLGSGAVLFMEGIFQERDTSDLRDIVVLWDRSKGAVDIRYPDRLGTFMVALRRYITTVVDLRINEKKEYGSLGPYEERIREIETVLREVIRPLFEEEVH